MFIFLFVHLERKSRQTDNFHLFSLAIAFFTWFGAHTLYNRYYLKLRGASQFPIPTFPSIRLPSFFQRSPNTQNGFGGGSSSTTNSKPGWGSWRRRSQRSSGYNAIRADEVDEEEGFAARFSLDDEDEEGLEDARALGNETNAWRGHTAVGGPAAQSDTQEGAVGVHQGLVQI